MLDMVITNVLYEKVVGNEYEEDGVPFVELKDRGGGGVLVAYFVEGWDGVVLRGILYLGAIRYFCVFVRREMGFIGRYMMVMVKYSLYVSINVEAK